ncbi:MAG: hypothetical protein GKS04_04795 [Candidatus Mycalebacterium zealandia]|nr:MAG: hypothetical protein GKS04_04795 [Candidatus Mycalebacterium zealandia]
MKKSLFFALVVALALSFSPSAKADVMDEGAMDENGSMMSTYMSDGNKEFVLKSGYYYQKARMAGPDAEEHGMSMGFELSRFIGGNSVFGLNFLSSLRFEPDLMIGFADVADHTLNHFSAPVFVQFDFPMETNPVELSAGVGTGLFIYDLGDQISREDFMPVIGKFAVDYVKRDGLKMGVAAKGHYVINRATGPVSKLWGLSGVARISFVF